MTAALAEAADGQGRGHDVAHRAIVLVDPGRDEARHAVHHPDRGRAAGEHPVDAAPRAVGAQRIERLERAPRLSIGQGGVLFAEQLDRPCLRPLDAIEPVGQFVHHCGIALVEPRQRFVDRLGALLRKGD